MGCSPRPHRSQGMDPLSLTPPAHIPFPSLLSLLASIVLSNLSDIPGSARDGCVGEVIARVEVRHEGY